MGAGRSRYEVRVGTVISPATLASLRVPVRPITVRRNTIYWIRVLASRDISEVLHRLTEHDVQVLEIRRRAEPSPSERRAVRPPSEESVRPVTGDVPLPADGVVVPFRRRSSPTPVLKPGGSAG